MSNISQTNRAPNKIAMEERKRGGEISLPEREIQIGRISIPDNSDFSQRCIRDDAR